MNNCHSEALRGIWGEDSGTNYGAGLSTVFQKGELRKGLRRQESIPPENSPMSSPSNSGMREATLANPTHLPPKADHLLLTFNLNPRTILCNRPPTPHVGPIKRKGTRSPVRPASPITTARTSKAVRDRSGVQPRLYPNPFPTVALQLNTHNKRCPKAQRLRLRSDLSTPHGRFPDKLRQALSKSHCQVSVPLNGRKAIAASGDAMEHGVKSLHRAIAPYPDSPAAYLAGESDQSEERRLKTNAPFTDSPAAAPGEADPLSGGHESTLPFLRMVEHFRWTRLPQSEDFSRLVHVPSEVWGKDSTVVTTGELPTTNGGHGSPLPSLGMVEHFRWTGLPHREIFSRLVHIPSEVWGCRRVDADATRPQGRTPSIGTGVVALMHKHRPGPSISSPLFSAIPSPVGVPLVVTLPGVGPLTLSLSSRQRGAASHPISPSHRSTSTPDPPKPTYIRRSCAGRNLDTRTPA